MAPQENLAKLCYSLGTPVFFAAGWISLESYGRFFTDIGGNVVLAFSLAFPVLLGAAGLAVESAGFYNQQSRMQSVADSTALALAKELHLFLENPQTLKAAGEDRAEALLAETGLAGYEHTTDVTLDSNQGFARVSINMATRGFLPPEVWGENHIAVTAEARTYGQVRLCILGLNEEDGDTIRADHAAALTAPDCAIQSNSSDPSGLRTNNLSTLVSLFICTSGGYDGVGFVPPPQTDCPALEDPLELRQPPPVGGCDFLDFEVEAGEGTIMPGHYCGGLKLSNDADVIAEPGIYVISGGAFEASSNSLLRGEDVSFYFADDAAVLAFKDEAVIELSAPREGPMAGILFYENPTAPPERNFEISSDSARKLLGTIYLPRGRFRVGSGGLVGDLSEYTIIVANRIELDGGVLIINADYAASDVPVPLGLGNNAQVRLSE
jgi:hypothetical protein